MVDLEMFKHMLGNGLNATDEVLQSLLDEAAGFILAYTNRGIEDWKPLFDTVHMRLSVSMFNRLGAEGLKTLKEGSVSNGFESLVSEFAPILSMYRVAKFR